MISAFRSSRPRLLLTCSVVVIALSLLALTLRERGFRADLAAGSRLEVDDAIAFARRSYLIGLLLGLAAAGAAFWLVTRRVAEGLEQVGEQVEELAAAEDFSAGELAPITVDEAFEGDEIAAMVSRLNELLERVEDGYRDQERFLQDASHELKTPIAVLRSEAQVLRSTNASAEDLAAFVVSVEEETERLGELMESLLRLARAGERSGLVRSTPHALNDVVMCAIDQCRGMARRRGVSFKVELLMPADDEPDEGRALVAGDFMLLVAMVGNFVRNALKYSERGGTVSVAVAEEAAELAVEVSDEGPGIPEDQLGGIFERFGRADPGQRAGTGLGLFIARSIAELHRARLTAENLERGCRFTARLPRAPSPDKAVD